MELQIINNIEAVCFNFQKMRSVINEEIKKSDGISINEIYRLAFHMCQNHLMVKAFMLNEKYTSKQISQAKYAYKLKHND